MKRCDSCNCLIRDDDTVCPYCRKEQKTYDINIISKNIAAIASFGISCEEVQESINKYLEIEKGEDKINE